MDGEKGHGERKGTMMKRYKMHLIILLALVFVVSGCGKTKDEEKKEKKLQDITVYEQLNVKKEPLTEENSSIVEKGVEEWASAFLMVNSDSKDKDVTDKVLYKNITNEKQRDKLKKERDEFYKDSQVTVEEVKAEITESNQAEYHNREVGVVKCKTTATGMRNNENFEKMYTMELVVDYKADVVSVYEVKSITWE